MITQNYMLNFMNNIPTVPTESNKLDKADSSNFPQFKEILDKAAYKAPELKNTQKDFKEEYKVKDNQDKAADQGVKFKSYKEAVNKDVKESSPKTENSKEVDSSSDLEKTEGKQKDKVSTKTKEDAAVDGLAQVLGVNPQELLQVLNKLNIEPKDLLDNSKVGEITDKLSNLLGLNDQQKQALSEMLKAVDANVNENSKLSDGFSGLSKAEDANKTIDPASKDSKESVNSQVPKVEVIKQDSARADSGNKVSSNQDIKAIVDSMKSKVDVFAKKLEKNPQEALSELKNELESTVNQKAAPTMSEAEIPAKTASDETKAAAKSDDQNKPQENVEAADPKDHSNSSGGKSEKKDNYSSDHPSSERSPAKLQDTAGEKVNTAENKPVQLDNIAVGIPQKVNDQDSIAKVTNNVPVTKSEIINQVVEKAKVVLSGEKSEMVMDLKPDNLGKLALKVVTERGLVVAKFVAESQQVKEVLESNMQLLKDSLEKQGLSVQGFSVSVQQDSSKGFNRDNEEGDSSRRGRLKSGGTADNMINVAEGLDVRQKQNPYAWAGSKFNLTA